MSSGLVSSVDAELAPQVETAPALREPLGATTARARALGAHVPICVVDAALLIGASATVAALSEDHVARTTLWSLAFAIAVIVSLANQGLYRPWIASRLLDTTRAIVESTAVAIAAVTAVRVLVGDSTGLAHQGVRLWVIGTGLLMAARSCQRFVAWRRAGTGRHGAPTLIVGAGEVGQTVARRLRASPQLGLRPIGFLDKEPIDGTRGTERLPVLGASWDIDDVVAEYRVRHIIVAFSKAPTDVLIRLLERCEQLGVQISYVPRLFEKTTERFALDHLGGLPLISPCAPNPRGWGFRAKYVIDRIVAAIAVVVLSPLLGLFALALLLTSGRPVLYRQERIGRDRRPFAMLKFRSMHTSNEPNTTPFPVSMAPDTAPGGVEGDDRRTRFGIFLRRTSLDELPQLLNVLKGDMSFVGPRPERPQFVGIFDETVRRYEHRHRVKSGITGWAQVNGLRGKTSIADRAECDNYYIENWSFWLDLKILLQTVVAVARPGNVE